MRRRVRELRSVFPQDGWPPCRPAPVPAFARPAPKFSSSLWRALLCVYAVLQAACSFQLTVLSIRNFTHILAAGPCWCVCRRSAGRRLCTILLYEFQRPAGPAVSRATRSRCRGQRADHGCCSLPQRSGRTSGLRFGAGSKGTGRARFPIDTDPIGSRQAVPLLPACDPVRHKPKVCADPLLRFGAGQPTTPANGRPWNRRIDALVLFPPVGGTAYKRRLRRV
jgi:hypothetical protein